MGLVKAARGLSLGVLALGCCPARGSVDAAAPSVEEKPVIVGRLPSIATPRTIPAGSRKDSGFDCREGAEERELIPVECSQSCTGHEVFVRYCAEGRWNSKTLEANCALCPETLPPALAECRIDRATLTPSELSSTDGCKLELTCGSEKLRAECDGENDGTNTSLCDCNRNGKEVRGVSNPVRGEAPESCLRAAEKCLTASRR